MARLGIAGAGSGMGTTAVDIPRNIIDQQDELKSWPDERLITELQNPGAAPQYLVFSEVKRRKDVRQRYAEQMAKEDVPELSMAQQAIMESLSPVAPVEPPSGFPGMPPGMPPSMPPGMPPRMPPGPMPNMPPPPNAPPMMPPTGDMPRGLPPFDPSAMGPPGGIPEAPMMAGGGLIPKRGFVGGALVGPGLALGSKVWPWLSRAGWAGGTGMLAHDVLSEEPVIDPATNKPVIHTETGEPITQSKWDGMSFSEKALTSASGVLMGVGAGRGVPGAVRRVAGKAARPIRRGAGRVLDPAYSPPSSPPPILGGASTGNPLAAQLAAEARGGAAITSLRQRALNPRNLLAPGVIGAGLGAGVLYSGGDDEGELGEAATASDRVALEKALPGWPGGAENVFNRLRDRETGLSGKPGDAAVVQGPTGLGVVEPSAPSGYERLRELIEEGRGIREESRQSAKTQAILTLASALLTEPSMSKAFGVGLGGISEIVGEGSKRDEARRMQTIQEELALETIASRERTASASASDKKVAAKLVADETRRHRDQTFAYYDKRDEAKLDAGDQDLELINRMLNSSDEKTRREGEEWLERLERRRAGSSGAGRAVLPSGGKDGGLVVLGRPR